MSSTPASLPTEILHKVIGFYIDDFRSHQATPAARVRPVTINQTNRGSEMLFQFPAGPGYVDLRDLVTAGLAGLELDGDLDSKDTHLQPLLVCSRLLKEIAVEELYRDVRLYDCHQAVNFFTNASPDDIRLVDKLYLAEISYDLLKVLNRDLEIFPLLADGCRLESLELGHTDANLDIALYTTVIGLCQPWKLIIRGHNQIVSNILDIQRKWGLNRVRQLHWTGSLFNSTSDAYFLYPELLDVGDTIQTAADSMVLPKEKEGPRLPFIQSLHITMVEAFLAKDTLGLLSSTHPSIQEFRPCQPTLLALGQMLGKSIVGDIHLNLYLVPPLVTTVVVNWAKKWDGRVTLGCDRTKDELMNVPSLDGFDISTVPAYNPLLKYAVLPPVVG